MKNGNEKKSILFLLSSMNIGGVEKALLGLLSIIPIEKYEIHLALLKEDGGYLSYLPKNINIHQVQCYDQNKEFINDPPLKVIKGLIRQGKLLDACVHFLLYVYFRVTSNRYWFYQYIMRKEPMLDGRYDLAVAYAGPSQMIDWYINKRVDACVKCGWIHFDISKFGIDKGMTRLLYKNYQKIFIVSKTAKKVFDGVFPQFSNKTEVFYNVLNTRQIGTMANEHDGFEDNYKGVRLLTVGRLSKEKGQDIAIHALKILLDKGYDVKWYFIGDGELKDECRSLAVSLNISDYIVFLGTKVNPYPYMKKCDIYVQPSRHEGYCITLAEARVFTNPIVATCFTGAKEQLDKRSNSLIVEMSADELAGGIIKVLMGTGTNTVQDATPFEETDVDNFLSLLV
ncbi:glycosyltransferase [Bacteroides faecium]|uniref:Glycosyltransferase n=1 Tax=Bacteroides faecium TaxID=2715212 RepID=A0A6H0KPN3_9BACE|nr:glycosyltransferase [Bacteroides faecium]QIU95143.1 glycosyltransferase [Bacteroides faecium]